MVAELLEAVAVLGIIKPSVLYFLTALGHAEQGAAAHTVTRKVGETVGLTDKR